MIVFRTIVFHFTGHIDGPIFKSERAAREWTAAAATAMWGVDQLKDIAWDRPPGISADSFYLKLTSDPSGASIAEVRRAFLI